MSVLIHHWSSVVSDEFCQGFKQCFIHFYLGNILSDCSRTQEAIIAYKRAIYLKPEFISVYPKLANCLSAMCRKDEAIEYLNKTVKINPDFADSYYTMGYIYKGEEENVHAI